MGGEFGMTMCPRMCYCDDAICDINLDYTNLECGSRAARVIVNKLSKGTSMDVTWSAQESKFLNGSNT